MKLSIIVPIYNVEKYLDKCIQSILNQTFKDFELILVDDGSPDKCPDMIDVYAKQDSRIISLHKPNGGLMSAWKYGVKRAKGEYIGFVDSDDWISSDMYEKLVSIAYEAKVDLVCSLKIYEYSGGNSIFEKLMLEPGYYDKVKIETNIKPYLIRSEKYLGRPISPNRFTKLFRRDLLLQILDDCNEDVTIGEDLVTTFAFINLAESIYLINDFHPYHYRIHNSSMSQIFSKAKYQKLITLKETLLKINSKYAKNYFLNQIHTDYIDLYLQNLEIEILYTKNIRELKKSIKESFYSKSVQDSLKYCNKKCLNRKNRLFLNLLEKNLSLLVIIIRKLKRVKPK